MTASAGIARSELSGFVYFIRSGDRPFVKIGWAIDPAARLLDLQCGNPERLTLLATLDGTMRDELAWQRRFGHLSVHGEWFHLTAELEDAIRHREEVAQEMYQPEADPDMPDTWRRYKEHLSMRRAKGMRARSPLDEEKVRTIRASKMTVRALAAEFGVSKTCVQDIRMGRTWRHIA